MTPSTTRAPVVDAHDLGRGDEGAVAERLPAAHVVAQLAVLRVARARDDGDRLRAAGAPAEPLVMRQQRRQQIVACCGRCRRRARRRRRSGCARAAATARDERGGDGVGVALHGRDGAVDLERARAPGGVDEEVDAHRRQLLRLAPGGAERLGLERGERAEQPLLAAAPATDPPSGRRSASSARA